MSERTTVLVRRWTAQLQENALAARILAEAAARQDDVQRCALDGLQRENAAFEHAAGEQFRKEAVGHCHDILNAMVAIATGRAAARSGDLFGFVRLHAERRARQKFPLAGSLNAYRLAHKGYWTVIREIVCNGRTSELDANACLMLLSEFLLEYFDTVSGLMTDAYLAEEKLLLARDARTRVALVEDLIHGRSPGDVETRELAERRGIRPGAVIAIALARPPADGMDSSAAPDPGVELVEGALIGGGLGAVVDRRDGAILAIATGETDTARRVASALRAIVTRQQDTAGAPLAIGVSLDVTAIAAMPQAYQEAERALDFAGPRRPVVHVADIDLVELLVRRPDPLALRLLPAWSGRLRDADREKAGALSRTIRAFADCDLNIKRTARRLDLHTNTIYFRLNRIRQLTNVDPRTFAGASLLLTTLRLLDASREPPRTRNKR